MRRQYLLTLALIFCIANSFNRAAICLYAPSSSTPVDLGQSPLSVCRFKKPFPFHSVQLQKKRLSNPPDVHQISAFQGKMGLTDSAISESPFLTHPLSRSLVKNDQASLQYFSTAQWYDGGVPHNIFHPPPQTV
jgi:hypothetical protein